MAKKLLMCKGLPGSGKSTWATAMLFNPRPLNGVRVNKDNIRKALGKPWSRELEKEVIATRDRLIDEAFRQGVQLVISDDTNLAPKHERSLRQMAIKHAATFEVVDFTDVSPEVCIERDAQRPVDEQVGEKVIWDMWNKYLKPKAEPLDLVPVVFDKTLSSVVICDLDGTLALSDGLRGPYEHEKCADDRVNAPVNRLLRLYKAIGYHLVYLSGREEKYRPQTSAFLSRNLCPEAPLHMRATGDKRNDTIVKSELFDKYIRGKYNVEFCLDDRDRVVKLWRDLGLTCFQVNYGNF